MQEEFYAANISPKKNYGQNKLVLARRSNRYLEKVYRKLNQKWTLRARNRRYLWKIEQKWTLGGLKINCRVATIDFQPSQSPFLIDFLPVTVHSFSKYL